MLHRWGPCMLHRWGPCMLHGGPPEQVVVPVHKRVGRPRVLRGFSQDVEGSFFFSTHPSPSNIKTKIKTTFPKRLPPNTPFRFSRKGVFLLWPFGSQPVASVDPHRTKTCALASPQKQELGDHLRPLVFFSRKRRTPRIFCRSKFQSRWWQMGQTKKCPSGYWLKTAITI